MRQRGIVGMIAERLSRQQQSDTAFDAEMDRGWIARILVVLFGFGGILLLSTLLLQGDPERDESSLAIVAAVAIGVAAGILIAYERLPVWFLRLAPAIGTILATLTIYFSGAQAAASYALYMAWVLVAAALFLDTRLMLAHGALSVAAYASALALLDGSDGLDPLRVTMMAGTVLVMAIVVGAITERLREVLRRLEAAASTDPLTGVMNRRALEEAFDVELARAGRGGFEVGVVMLDLDGFKAFNDQHGHQAGDSALRRLSRVLTDQTRTIDQVGRVGGEEFAIIAPESNTAGTLALAERLRRAVELEFSGPGGLTASCGVASYPESGADREELVGAADRALYQAKALGRNRAIASSVTRGTPPGAVVP